MDNKGRKSDEEEEEEDTVSSGSADKIELFQVIEFYLQLKRNSSYMWDTVVSYQNESFSSKLELPFLPPSSLEL